MKKLLSSLLISAFALTSFAQGDSAGFKPTKGDKGFSGAINGLAILDLSKSGFAGGGVLFRYYASDKLAIRLGLGAEGASNTQKDDITVPGVENTNKNSYTSFGIIPGVQLAMGNLNRLEPYVGLDLPIQIFNQKTVVRNEVTDATQAGFGTTNGDYTETETKAGGNFRIGIAGILGFNYYLAKNFALGAEYGYGPKIGFVGKNSVTTTSSTGGVEADPITNEGPGNTAFTFNGTHTGVVTFSVFW